MRIYTGYSPPKKIRYTLDKVFKPQKNVFKLFFKKKLKIDWNITNPDKIFRAHENIFKFFKTFSSTKWENIKKNLEMWDV